MLPQLQVPIYELNLPSNGKTIKYRPFTVKEKKLFLLLREAQDVKDLINTIKQVIKNCIVSPTDIDVDSMAIVDIEMLFVHLRARADGEIQELEFECKNMVGDGEKKPCGAITKVSFNLLDSFLEKNPDHKTKIELTEKVGISMKYPTYAMSQILTKENPTPTEIIEIVVDCIDYVYDSDKLYYAKNEKRDDLIKWFEGMSDKNFEKVMTFFETSPKVIIKSDFRCHKCEYEEEIRLQGIQDFFG